MRWTHILDACGVSWAEVAGDADVSGVSSDSRTVVPGDCFVVMPSERTDTAGFLGPARENGAVAAIVPTQAAFVTALELGLAAAYCPNSGHCYNVAVGRFCREFFKDPTTQMRVIGVTGTNGKTTTAWMMREALAALGRKAAYLGTLGFHHHACGRELSNTTPFPVELWRLLVEARDAGCTDLVMEASSHALVQRRLAGVSFAAGIFTNLSQDHLDFHGTMEHYADSKKLLFTEAAMASRVAFGAAINGADPIAQSWIPDLPTPVVVYGAPGGFECQSEHVGLDRIVLVLPSGNRIEAAVGGNFNVSNLTSAAAGLLSLGYDDAQIAVALSQVTPVPGRFETVGNSEVGVIVDYAHTPDALEKLLSSARALGPRRIITVFGCGGDRDRTKRPKMAAVVSKLSDVSVVTSDNPRTEDPISIIEEVRSGLVAGAQSESIIDRREAIERAITLAEPGDVVVIAGKGHENYQIIGHTKFPMDDRQMAREALARR